MFSHRAAFSLTALRPYLSAALCENARTYSSLSLSARDPLLKFPSTHRRHNRKHNANNCYRIFGRKQNEPFCYHNMTVRKQIQPICSRIQPIWTPAGIYSHERTKHENIPCKKRWNMFPKQTIKWLKIQKFPRLSYSYIKLN